MYRLAYFLAAFSVCIVAPALGQNPTISFSDQDDYAQGDYFAQGEPAYLPAVVQESDLACETCDETCDVGCCKSKTLSLFGGLNWVEVDDDFDLFSPSPDFQSDWIAGLCLGRRHNKYVRSELEFAYRLNEEDEPLVAANPPANGAFGINGEIEVYTGMFNLLIDLNNTKVRPYFGAGIGYAHLNSDLNVFTGNTVSPISTSQDVLAYQGIGGVASTINGRSEFYLEYHYLGLSDLDPLAGQTAIKINDFAHSFVGGLRIEF